MARETSDRKMTLTSDKIDTIDDILANQTYMPDSEIVKRLEKVLMKLSLTDLRDLSLIINCK